MIDYETTSLLFYGMGRVGAIPLMDGVGRVKLFLIAGHAGSKVHWPGRSGQLCKKINFTI